MPDEQAQNTTPDAPQAPTGDVQNGAVKDTTPANPETAPSEPFDPAPDEPVPANDEPIDIPPFDNSPTPTPTSAPQAHGVRDLLAKARATIQQRKQKKLEKILEMFSTKPNITNNEVEKLLHVSDATTTRYLSELERQGKIRQVGKTGHAVVYTRI